MATVRCKIHHIPYNEENPRGCPACAQESRGKDSRSIIQELAKAQQARRSSVSVPTGPPKIGGRPAEPAPKPAPAWIPAWLADLTARSRNRIVTWGGPLALILLIIVVARSGPNFVKQQDPPEVPSEQMRPLPVRPNQQIETVFSFLGETAPRPHPEFRKIERYSYGSDLSVEAINGVVYVVSLSLPNRTWENLSVGMSETRARGNLARLGNISESETDPGRAAEVGGWITYPSPDARPTKLLTAQVRPPNGCFDVTAHVQPRAIGTVVDGGRRLVAVAESGDRLEWVVTKLEIFSRSVRGPFTGPPVC